MAQQSQIKAFKDFEVSQWRDATLYRAHNKFVNYLHEMQVMNRLLCAPISRILAGQKNALFFSTVSNRPKNGVRLGIIPVGRFFIFIHRGKCIVARHGEMEVIMEYVLEIKQIVDFPRVRIYRPLIQRLIGDKHLSSRGTSNLFLFMILCSYANFRSSRKRIDGKKYLIGPGEWICSLKDLAGWFRLPTQSQVVDVLESLKKRNFIRYSFLPGGKMLRYKIQNWEKFNTVLEYECRSQKDCGFFFFPITYGEKLMSGKSCSDLDALMDLWLNTIYKDHRVKGSDIGPVVYFRNCTGEPMTSCSRLAKRWGRSRATVNRIISKLEDHGFLTNIVFSGGFGSVMYLNNYLSIMFNISDIDVDKDEVSFSIGLKVKIEDNELDRQEKEEIGVSKSKIPVSNLLVNILASKVLEMLTVQGFSCCGCRKKTCILSSLSGACEGFTLGVGCGKKSKTRKCKKRIYWFEVRIVDSSG